MSLWWMLLAVAVAGAVGGAVNALLTENGFIFPKTDVVDTTPIWRPGFLGTMAVGAAAATVSWGLYGPFASYAILGPAAPAVAGTPPAVGLTLSALVGALLVGMGGGRWLTDQADKGLLKAAAVKAAAGSSDASASAKIAAARPAAALEIARRL
ncbi:MAG: hypothetical protein KJ061_07955 [Vicinamibacteraceae bacterium]|nr:hypothetical protein [Vicinamibacteraceae bacterium]